MNKKGYTLIELIGVVVILALMVLLLANLSNKAIKEAKQKTNKQCEENAIMAAQNWVLDNKDKIENTKLVSIQELQNEGYLEITNCISENKCIKIEKKEGIKTVYNYNVVKEC